MKKRISKYFILQVWHEARMTIQGLVIGGAALYAWLETHPESKAKVEEKLKKLFK